MLLSIYLRVPDYEKFKSTFDERHSVRAQYGVKRHSIFRQEGSPNQLLITLELPDSAAAHRYVDESGLREAIQSVGAQGEPGFAYFDELETVGY